ncbi:hypothetical protein ACFYO1_02705 [Nocardia sp. NPDC006044]|uniref:hypothetical protein n=1 Tax=Nocardia sp. NPDC006044 TaxID=3364306 RepID=UPI003677C50F
MSNSITRALAGIVHHLTRLTSRGAGGAAELDRNAARSVKRDVDEEVHADHLGKREIEQAGGGPQAPEHGTRTGPTPKTPVRTGLGKDVDEFVALSPTLSTAIRDLQASPTGKWKITYGEEGKGIFCDTAARRIILDPGYARKGSYRVVYALAHEVGHARLVEKHPGLEDLFYREGMTRIEWVQAQYRCQIRSEGEAELTALDVRKEILNNGGPDIYPDYNYGDVYERYEHGYISRHVARGEIAKYLGARTVNTTGETYTQYYGKFYYQLWDQLEGAGRGAGDRYGEWFEPLPWATDVAPWFSADGRLA